MSRRIALFLFAAIAWAQPKFEIRGTVTDPNTNQPLQGVMVTVIADNGALYDDANAQHATTDIHGAFHYDLPKAGRYVVRADKHGYAPVTNTDTGPYSDPLTDQRRATLSVEKPTAVLTLLLEGQGQVSGRVIDDDTEKPLAKLRVGVNNYGSINGRVSARGGFETSDADGQFERSVAAGRYVVEIQPQNRGSDRVITTFTEEDTRATDLDYRSQFFPGGRDANSALPISVVSGGSASFGTIRLRKQPLNRVFVNLDPSSCPSGAQLSVFDITLRFQSAESRRLEIPCGPFLLTHVTPGDHELELRAGKVPDDLSASIRYTITERNLELPMRLSQGTTLRGTVVAAQGAGELPLTMFKVLFYPITSLPPLEVQPHIVDAKGRFEFVNVQAKRRKVQVAGLGSEYFIKEVRYRGSAQPGGIFYYTGDGELEIEIGRSPASLTGTVMSQDKPLPNADVVFMRWPAEPDDDRDAIRHIAADADGKFQINGIVPGEYRLFALAAKDRSQAEQPAPWQQLVTRAEKLSLAKGASQSLTVQASDPSR